jgi:hypothetical protein
VSVGESGVARFCTDFRMRQPMVQLALPLPLSDHRSSEKVIYVEFDLLLRNRP